MGKKVVQRPVYLRTSSNAQVLSAGLELLDSSSQPLVMPLQDITGDVERALLVETAEESPVMLLTPSGLGTLPQGSEQLSSATLASDALLDGGRGLMDASSVGDYLEAVDHGVIGAREGDRESTDRAVATVARSTAPKIAERMTTFLAALWQGGGRSLTEFPGRISPHVALDEASLGMLLRSPEIDDAAFWQRISTMSDFRSLLAAQVHWSLNLQHLMRHAAQHWTAHVCMVVSEEHTGPSHRSLPSPWQWVVEDGLLGLRVPGHVAYVAGSRRELPMPEEYSVPRLNDVRARANRFSTTVTGFRMITENRTVGYDAARLRMSHGIRNFRGSARHSVVLRGGR